jgi:hypothetical protein
MCKGKNMDTKEITITAEMLKNLEYKIEFPESAGLIVPCDCGWPDCTGEKIIYKDGSITTSLPEETWEGRLEKEFGKADDLRYFIRQEIERARKEGYEEGALSRATATEVMITKDMVENAERAVKNLRAESRQSLIKELIEKMPKEKIIPDERYYDESDEDDGFNKCLQEVLDILNQELKI